MKFFLKIFKYIISIILLFGILGFASIFKPLIKYALHQGPYLTTFLAGASVFIILWFFYFSKSAGFWSTLEHELTHAFFALLFFRRVHSISASRKTGGYISIDSGNVIIALSPYIFPSTAIILLLIKLILPMSLEIFLNFFIGYVYAFHFVNLIKEFHPGQPDIRVSGYVQSLIFVIFFNILFFIFFISTLNLKSSQILEFLHLGLTNTLQLIFQINATLKTFL